MPSEGLALLVLVLALGCGRGDASTLVRPGDPAAIRLACAVADTRCTHCHTLDRVLELAARAPDWPVYVRRMRLQPGSGITAPEEQAIVRCLAFRTRGQLEVAP